MLPILTVFAQSPDGGRGLARDMPVRWALEEAGQPYEVRPVAFADLKQPAHRARQPFGQIPVYEDGALTLFESGAIVLHIAERSKYLLPGDADARARATCWMFAALNTIEPPVWDLAMAAVLEGDKPWHAERHVMLEARMRARLGDLVARLGDADWLDGAFSAGDLLTINVLRRLAGSGMLGEFPAIAAYVRRGEARPAFRRAFAAQLALFAASGQHAV
jgi:glutathione S-transferase